MSDNEQTLGRNIGLDLIRVTETTALTASRWIGSGDYAGAHSAASRAMFNALSTMEVDGNIVLGEARRVEGQANLSDGQSIGTGNGPQTDLAIDPIDGTNLMIKGRAGAISVAAIAPRGAMWLPSSARYMDKIVVDSQAAEVLVPECLDAPAAWTLALIARAKNKAVRDLTVIVLSRSRHLDLIDEIRATGARVLLREEGDAEGALIAAAAGDDADALMGIGGASQGVLAACAVRALGGGMLARLAPQSEQEMRAIEAEGLDNRRVLTAEDLVSSNQIFFAATGVTNSLLLPPLRFKGGLVHTHSLLIRAVTGTRRFIHAEHLLSELDALS